ncbi:hypothetical protein MUK42_16621 [Musa troglodytarum]|uniref:Uncharacterized protein n=1 Tax=Musa troglodytarum TaxID=320322 RepID=A0A9E7HAJ8_9LILI|nr:hypothetical protein MUK42_16621 [Musa troglodytarum]
MTERKRAKEEESDGDDDIEEKKRRDEGNETKVGGQGWQVAELLLVGFEDFITIASAPKHLLIHILP